MVTRAKAPRRSSDESNCEIIALLSEGTRSGRYERRSGIYQRGSRVLLVLPQAQHERATLALAWPVRIWACHTVLYIDVGQDGWHLHCKCICTQLHVGRPAHSHPLVTYVSTKRYWGMQCMQRAALLYTYGTCTVFVCTLLGSEIWRRMRSLVSAQCWVAAAAGDADASYDTWLLGRPRVPLVLPSSFQKRHV